MASPAPTPDLFDYDDIEQVLHGFGDRLTRFAVRKNGVVTTYCSDDARLSQGDFLNVAFMPDALIEVDARCFAEIVDPPAPGLIPNPTGLAVEDDFDCCVRKPEGVAWLRPYKHLLAWSSDSKKALEVLTLAHNKLIAKMARQWNSHNEPLQALLINEATFTPDWSHLETLDMDPLDSTLKVQGFDDSPFLCDESLLLGEWRSPSESASSLSPGSFASTFSSPMSSSCDISPSSFLPASISPAQITSPFERRLSFCENSTIMGDDDDFVADAAMNEVTPASPILSLSYPSPLPSTPGEEETTLPPSPAPSSVTSTKRKWTPPPSPQSSVSSEASESSYARARRLCPLPGRVLRSSRRARLPLPTESPSEDASEKDTDDNSSEFQASASDGEDADDQPYKERKQVKRRSKKRARTTKKKEPEVHSYCPFPECGMGFSREHDMNRHFESKHLGKGPCCHRCGKTYSRNDSLGRHWRTVKCSKERALRRTKAARSKPKATSAAGGTKRSA